ncbi:hypothetical protein E5676_scaffold1856G00080 [Cucumis melo var. makuwa]|uniref:Uncharacterized protein n=1 Tax=Cucumis melo var. makuwa TaxID=1194695 RepID=A0A5D3BZ71_CUCMM|nr:hypothetical protein E5676_scaffold1856G00080 [Cucumis melo var. makuwa]
MLRHVCDDVMTCYMLWIWCMLALAIRVVPAWVSFRITNFLGLRSPTGAPTDIDINIDMIRVIRRDCSQPDCLSVSFGYTKDQFVLDVPLGSPKTRYVPRDHRLHVFENVPVQGYYLSGI